MIYIKFNDSPSIIGVKFKRISENVVSLGGITDINSSGFKTYTESGSMLGDFREYKTLYRVLNNEVQYSNNGEVYVEAEPFVPREPTQEEIKQALIDGTQDYMDEVARTRGYDSILSACSYVSTGVERFDVEGEQARIWRSAVWAYCYAQLDLVLEGKRSIPSLEELIEELPKISW